jgi:DAACS family dicarboxylate/amino acid:cation (Na+ or H+) symporter
MDTDEHVFAMIEPDAPKPPATPSASIVEDEPEVRPGGLPLYAWVLMAVALAVPVGMALGMDASVADRLPGPALAAFKALAVGLDLMPKLIIRAIGALAAPLIVLAILQAIVTNELHGRQAARMMAYYLVNTLIAMVIGLGLSNLIRPGVGANLGGGAVNGGQGATRLIQVLAPVPLKAASLPPSKTVTDILIDLVPKSIGDAFSQNNLAQLVLLTLAFGIALTKLRDEHKARGETSYRTLVNIITAGFELLMKVLMWVIALVPLAVFGVVAVSIAREGFDLFINLGWFIVAVLIGLALQVSLYLGEMGLFARMSPTRFLRSSGDVLATTFSTASTAATIPVTLRSLTSKLGVSRASSQMAACIGTNFNNDGTALYQASAVLFFAQAMGNDLPLTSQVIIVLTTLIASVGAGGIPSGSFVTLPLIFTAVGLSADSIPLLLTIDWFLDRCRTSSNVLGDMTVAVLLDRTEPSLHGNEPNQVEESRS